jgi:hypothetical protein
MMGTPLSKLGPLNTANNDNDQQSVTAAAAAYGLVQPSSEGLAILFLNLFQF